MTGGRRGRIYRRQEAGKGEARETGEAEEGGEVREVEAAGQKREAGSRIRRQGGRRPSKRQRR